MPTRESATNASRSARKKGSWFSRINKNRRVRKWHKVIVQIGNYKAPKWVLAPVYVKKELVDQQSTKTPANTTQQNTIQTGLGNTNLPILPLQQIKEEAKPNIIQTSSTIQQNILLQQQANAQTLQTLQHMQQNHS